MALLFIRVCWGAGLGWGQGRAEAQSRAGTWGELQGRARGLPFYIAAPGQQVPGFLTSVPHTLCSRFALLTRVPATAEIKTNMFPRSHLVTLCAH